MAFALYTHVDSRRVGAEIGRSQISDDGDQTESHLHLSTLQLITVRTTLLELLLLKMNPLAGLEATVGSELLRKIQTSKILLVG
jgi:hypothetical protein